MRFSIRSILLLSALLAVWPKFGSLIAPTVLVVSLATVTVTTLMKSKQRTVFRLSLRLFIAISSLYLSFGPATWGMARYVGPDSTAPSLVIECSYQSFQYVFEPIATNLVFAPAPIRQVGFKYLGWWMPRSVVLQDMGKGIGWSRGPNWYTVVVYH